MLWVWIMFSSLDLVRRNINRAVSDNMLGDLGVNTNDYNTGQTIYLVSFLAAELPGGLISKKVGPFRYTPAVIVLWGGLCMCQAGMNARWNFWLLRSLLGIAQGGFIPEMILYLSYFYKSSELAIRLSVFYTAIPLTQTYGSLLAGGILQMRGVNGWAGWQWLFLLEGIICVLIGVAAFFLMPPSITEPALAFKRPDGTNKWWTEEEEKILVNRLLRDDPTKGDMNNRTAVSFKKIIKTIIDPDLLPIYIIGIFVWIPFQPTANYLSLTLRNLGYSVFESNVLAIPGYMLFTFNVSSKPCFTFERSMTYMRGRSSSSVGYPRGSMNVSSSVHAVTFGCFHSSSDSSPLSPMQTHGSDMPYLQVSTVFRIHTPSWSASSAATPRQLAVVPLPRPCTI